MCKNGHEGYYFPGARKSGSNNELEENRQARVRRRCCALLAGAACLDTCLHERYVGGIFSRQGSIGSRGEHGERDGQRGWIEIEG